MGKYVLLSSKDWHYTIFDQLSKRKGESWVFIHKTEDFNLETLDRINPVKIFIPHWSNIIPKSIYEKFDCVVFHMTDLPYGRGGSPLQNLIIRGHKLTKISALKVIEELDAGDIYLKYDLSLSGSAFEIFERSSEIIISMIKKIIDKRIKPTPQVGEPVIFKRRKPEDGNLLTLSNLMSVYDHIRMLDAPSYPNAFIETEYLRFEFFSAAENGNKIYANVRIIQK